MRPSHIHVDRRHPRATPGRSGPDLVPERERAGALRRASSGITLFELLIVIGVVGLLAAMSLDLYGSALDKARITRAVIDLRSIEKTIAVRDFDGLPASLDEIGWGNRLDPWGRPYRYVNFALESKNGENVAGIARKDRFLVPLNSDYDLYSVGPDGKSKQPLTAQQSRDDILRASDGAFIGPASEF